MSREIVYADLNIRAGMNDGRGDLLPQPGVLHQHSENPRSREDGSEDVGDATTPPDLLSELRKRLCSSKIPDGEGCKLCPSSWRLCGTKCCWVSNEMRTWFESKKDCEDRGAELLMPQDEEELEFLNQTLQKPSSYFWIGLSSSIGKGWTWLNGSLLDQNRFPLVLWDKVGACGALKGNRIITNGCTAGLSWICQKEATQL
ncbi:killer cell lectin-like receptor subfamily F member 1 [Aegotheles albertisi]